MTALPVCAPPVAPTRPRGSVARILVATTTAVTAVVVWHAHAGTAQRATQATVVTGVAPVASVNAAIEHRWGVRFTQLGVTADGGMIDLRYQALDEAKAHTLAEDVPSIPVLVEESSQRVLYAVVMKAHPKEIVVGGTYYLLYRNTGGTVRAGDTVTIRIGSEQIQHVAVMGTR